MQSSQLDGLKKWFRSYVDTFYGDDDYVNANIKLKDCHTFRVCGEINFLSDKLTLCENDRLIAETTALLHDVGRFPQFLQYRTFVDPDSIDHSELAVEILREQNVLIDLDENEGALIETAVRVHGKKQIPDDLDERTTFFAKLLRDSDKLDIYYLVVQNYKQNAETPQQLRLEMDFPDSPEYSENVAESLLNDELIDYAHLRTNNDYKLMQLGWVLDINFPETLCKVKDCGYLKYIMDALPKTETTSKVCRHIQNYVDKKTNATGTP